jgi:hypothetical protein
MKFPLFIAHGAELAYAILLWYVGGMLISGLTCWLGFKRKKIATLAFGLPALAFGVLLASNARFGLGWLPLGAAIAGLIVTFLPKPPERKVANQPPENNARDLT